MKDIQTITLTDGRRLDYAEYGDLRGRPILFFHGQPGNRLFRYPDDGFLVASGIRLITIDRPGYGLSDFQPDRRLLDWHRDVVELADSLGLEGFAVLGFSAGGPYALACALQIPQHITKVGLVDSAPPMDAPEIRDLAPFPLRMNSFLARRLPAVLKLTFSAYWRYSRRNPEAFIRTAIRQSPQPDREILARPDLYAMLVEVWKENIRVDCLGYVQDVEILMRPWGFRLGDVTAEVHMWQGEADTNTPQAWARYMARELPHCQAAFFANEGHFALFTHWQAILQSMART